MGDDYQNKMKREGNSSGGDKKKESIEKPIKTKQIKGKTSFVCAGKI